MVSRPRRLFGFQPRQPGARPRPLASGPGAPSNARSLAGEPSEGQSNLPVCPLLPRKPSVSAIGEFLAHSPHAPHEGNGVALTTGSSPMPDIAATTRRRTRCSRSMSPATARPHQGHQARLPAEGGNRARHRPSQKRPSHGPQLPGLGRGRRQQRRARRRRLQLQPPAQLAVAAFVCLLPGEVRNRRSTSVPRAISRPNASAGKTYPTTAGEGSCFLHGRLS